MEFRVLGPLEVNRDGAVVPIGSAQKLRLVLAALLSRADRPVALDWLTRVVWGDQPPASARQNLQHYIHRLRANLASDRISSGPGGYVIHVGDGLDAARFRQLAAKGTAALNDGDGPEAATRLRAALDLWRGPAYVEFTDSPSMADEATRLDDLRLSVSERWADAEMLLGHHDDLIETLSDLVRTHPYRESVRGLLMRALYGAGRQADALELFRSTRAMLAEHLGIEPGPELQRLHERMLRSDVQLARHVVESITSAPAVHGGGIPVPRELPGDVSGFTGRENELKALDGWLPLDAGSTGPVVISVITGTPGVGKTALALRWGHRVAEQFPDGQLYLNLRGYAPGSPLRPIDALAALLGALGVPPQQVPMDVAAAAARYRSHLAGRRMLIVLDNARSPAQVRPALPAGPGCMVLITSRDRLTGLVAQDGARRLTLDMLRPEESVDLLGHLLGEERVATEPAAVGALARTCAHLPLALRIAGAALADQPHRTIASYVAALSASNPVAALSVDGDDVAIRGAFQLSYRALPRPARQMFRRLGLVPCPDYTAGSAAVLAGTSGADALHALNSLAAAHLVVEHAAGRFSMHDLLRQFAGDLAATEGNRIEQLAAADRLHAWFEQMSRAATSVLSPEALRLPSTADGSAPPPELTGTGRALDWLENERHNLVAAIQHAARHGPHETAWRCADALRSYHAQRGLLADWLCTSRAALGAARAEGDPLAQASAYLGLAHVHYASGRYRRAMSYLQRCLEFAGDAGWDHGEATALKNLGIVMHRQGRTQEAVDNLNRALQIYERIDWPLGQAKAMENLANAYQDLGRLHDAVEVATRARALFGDNAAPRGVASTNQLLGELYCLLGRLDEAVQMLDLALPVLRAFGARVLVMGCQVWLARIHRDTGRLDEAAAFARTAVDLADEIGEPEYQAAARHTLGLVLQALADCPGAIALHQMALTIAERVDVRHLAGEALLGLASANCAGGDPRTAIGYAERALRLARTAGFAVIEGLALTTLGRAHLDLGDPDRALGYATEALTNHRRTGHRLGEAGTRGLLATIWSGLNDRYPAGRSRTASRSPL